MRKTPLQYENKTTLLSYRDEDMGFQLQYPATWKVAERKERPATPLISLTSDIGAVILLMPEGEYDRGLPPEQSKEDIVMTVVSRRITVLFQTARASLSSHLPTGFQQIE